MKENNIKKRIFWPEGGCKRRTEAEEIHQDVFNFQRKEEKKGNNFIRFDDKR